MKFSPIHIKKLFLVFSLAMMGLASNISYAADSGKIVSGNYKFSYGTFSGLKNAQAFSLGKDKSYACVYSGQANLDMENNKITLTVKYGNFLKGPQPDCTIYTGIKTFANPVIIDNDNQTISFSSRPPDDPNYNKYIATLKLKSKQSLFGGGYLQYAIPGYPDLMWAAYMDKL